MIRPLALALLFFTFPLFAAPAPLLPVSQFAVDMYAQLRGTSGNVFFSPASIYTALAMVYVGARGKTAEEIATALHSKDLAGAGSLVQGDRGEYKLVTANSLWGQKGYEFLPPFLKRLETDFASTFQTVDFKSDPSAARKEVNKWVESKTNEKIKDLVPPDAVNKMTRLILVNAIYFKAAWMQTFMKEQTRAAVFHVDGKTKVKVPIMHNAAMYYYADDGDVQVVELPYEGDRVGMVILLPKKRDGLAALEKGLTAEKVQGWIGKMQANQLVFAMPRFKVSSEFLLGERLKTMGIKTAFTDQADFSGMSKARDLAVSDVIHKAFADVDEHGTEAAAATAAMMFGAGAPKEPLAMAVDHPFLFLIRDRMSGATLFLGRVVDPR